MSTQNETVATANPPTSRPNRHMPSSGPAGATAAFSRSAVARNDVSPRPGHFAWLRSSTALWASVAFVLVLAAALAVPELLASQDPLTAKASDALQGPSFQYPFGTDRIGRDIYSRVIHGARFSLLIGIASMVISLLAGLVLGVAAALGGKVVDEIASRLFDVLSAFPGVLLAMLVVTFTGPGVQNIAIAIGISGVPKFARVIRAQTLSVKRSEYVRAAPIYGRSSAWVLLKHVLPNVLVAIPVIATIDIGTSIVAVSGLSFLGLGPQPPVPEWGVMLAESRAIVRTAWWAGVFPGLAITLSVISLTVIGRTLQTRFEGRNV